MLGYLIAFLVLLATVKLWHLMRLNSKLHMITATLQRAWTDISGFLVVITIMTLAYSIAVRTPPHYSASGVKVRLPEDTMGLSPAHKTIWSGSWVWGR